PPTDNNRPRRVPRPVDLVLVLLQADEPPAAPAHRQRRHGAPDHHAQQPAAADGPPPARPRPRPYRGPGQDHAGAAPRAEHQQHREHDVEAPGAVARVAAEHGRQAKDLDAEQREAEDLARGGQAAREHGRGHERGVGGQRGDGEAAHAAPVARVVEEEDVDGQQPEGHGPDAVRRGRARQRLEDRRQAQQREVDEHGRLDGAEAQVRALRAQGGRGPVVVVPEFRRGGVVGGGGGGGGGGPGAAGVEAGAAEARRGRVERGGRRRLHIPRRREARGADALGQGRPEGRVQVGRGAHGRGQVRHAAVGRQGRVGVAGGGGVVVAAAAGGPGQHPLRPELPPAEAPRVGEPPRGGVLVVRLLHHPPVPEEPAEEGREAAEPHHGDGAHALLEDADEAHDEDDDGADVLHDDGEVGDQGPELVRLQARVPLQVLEKGGLVCVVVRICSFVC
ncbi:uncharacterized protein E0L32_008357, partial [Thyridium curvatum]